jgi:hypothetical protein
MKQFIAKYKKSVLGIAACLLIGLVALSFQDSPLVHAKTQVSGEEPLPGEPFVCKDTTPPSKKLSAKEMEKLNVELEQALKTVAAKLKEVDWSKVNLQVSEALKEIDFEKIKASIDQSLKSVDFAAIEKEVETALKEVDMGKVNAEIKQSLQEAKREMEKVNWEEIKKELAEARAEIEKARMELKGIDMDKIMDEAKEGIEKAKAELKQLKTLLTELEKDGLIDRKKNVKLEYKDGSLYIDGKQQSKEVSDKYCQYVKDGKLDITINKEDKAEI